MARKVVAMTAKATAKVARVTGAGATMTTATAATAATMTPNGEEDNKDGNSKNNDKAMTTPPSITEGDASCQSCRGHQCPPRRRH